MKPSLFDRIFNPKKLSYIQPTTPPASGHTTAVQEPPYHIKAKSVREDAPEWEREYKVDLGGGFRIVVVLKNYLSGRGRFDSSTLYQSDGKCVRFDAHRVADKILDRELYRRVQLAVDLILAMDRDYINSDPDSFVDERGVVWIRSREKEVVPHGPYRLPHGS